MHNPVATDAMLLKQQAISKHSDEQTCTAFNRFHEKILHIYVNNFRISCYIFKNNNSVDK